MVTAEEMNDTLLAMHMQASEVGRLVQESGDFELAFQMQLDEALMISTFASSATSLSARTSTENEESPTLAVDEDRQTALTEQKQEMERLNQEMEDEVEALREQSRLAEIQAISEHDGRFATFLSSIPDTEWNTSGRNLTDPFTYTAETPTLEFNFNNVTACKRKAIDMDLVAKSKDVTDCKGKAIYMDDALVCQRDMWEPAVAAAFLLDVYNPVKQSSILTIKDGFHFDKQSVYTGQSLEGTLGREEDRAICGICMEAAMTTENSFIVSPECMHRFCRACLQKHAEAAVAKGKSFITCPQFRCENLWPTELNETLLSSKFLLLLTQRQIEEAFPESERVYCPFRDCSALQLKPELPAQPSSSSHPHQTAVGGVECFACSRYFCLECQVPWHSDITCEEFQGLPKDDRTFEDVVFKGLAKQKKWQRCKKCGVTVELQSGCYHITCRCGNDFCYVCGGSWAHGHICGIA